MPNPIILCDLNGTLLDMSVLNPNFQSLFGSADFREQWFQQLQTLWMTTIATETFRPFSKLAQAALQMIAAKEKVKPSATASAQILQTMQQLPPYPDAAEALNRLRDGGFRIAALTNGAMKSARAQLKFAKLADCFETVFSTEQVDRYKPAREPYLLAAKRMKVKPKQMLLVAAHAWDIEGAYQAGLQTAFVARPRQVLNPLAAAPDYQATDLTELAQQLIGKA